MNNMMRTITKAAAIAAVLIALTPAATAATPQATDLTQQFRDAGAAVDRLQVYEIAGIVIIRGRVADKAEAARINELAGSLGYARIANLVQTVEHDDNAIARRAEVELSVHRSLDGCRFTVTANKGVVRVAGQVTHELQKDVAAAVLRRIDGVRSVEMSLNKF
jgi:osmotically-inducible protein OsmY